MNLSANRLSGYFKPTPRFSNKLPALYIDSRNNPDDPFLREVYLVNATSELIEHVRMDRGFISGSKDIDGEAAGLLSQDYALVLPGDAVLLDTYHEIYDSDGLNQLRFSVTFRGQEPEAFNIISNGLKSLGYKVLHWAAEPWPATPAASNDNNAGHIALLARVIAAMEEYYTARGTAPNPLAAAKHCGCYYCLATMPLARLGYLQACAIDQACPECGINALIPDTLGIALLPYELAVARHLAFAGHMDDTDFTIEWDDQGR